MMNLIELKKILKDKNIILDNGVLTRSVDHFPEFQEFILMLQEIECVLTYFPMVEFEFMRGAISKEHREKRNAFLKEFHFQSLPIKGDEISKDAIAIASAYASRKISPSIVDCYIASYAKQYAKNLFIATLNHKDFPTFLFNRVYVWPIGTEKDVYPIGIYQFDDAKAKKIGIV